VIRHVTGRPFSGMLATVISATLTGALGSRRLMVPLCDVRGPRSSAVRRTGPVGGPACPRGGRRRAPSPPHDRSARLGQDDAGRASPRAPAPPHASGGADGDPLRRRGRHLGGRPLHRPPFRAPHHRSSVVALVGGGSWSLRPGEVSLATPRVWECP